MNTARQMIWLPTTREQSIKRSRQQIPSLLDSDILSAALVVGTTLLPGPHQLLFKCDSLLVVAGVGILLIRRYRALTKNPDQIQVAAKA
jgi:hypothetical protein